MSNQNIEHAMLRSIFAKHWNTTLLEFSSRLHEKRRNKDIDPLLVASFLEELKELGVPDYQAASYVTQLTECPVIQTTHHVAPTNGPTFLAADLITLAGLKPQQIYMVGAISGLPFSNPALSGHLLFSDVALASVIDDSSSFYRETARTIDPKVSLSSVLESASPPAPRKVSLIPARMRNALVYSAVIPSKLPYLWPSLSQECRDALTPPIEGTSYSHWACQSCAALQRRILQITELIYLDMNRVVAKYIAKALATAAHPIARILLDPVVARDINLAFDLPTLFLKSEDPGSTPRVISVTGEDILASDHGSSEQPSVKLRMDLASGRLCPSMFLVLFALRFLNGIRCLGGFLQIGYAERYRLTWQNLGDQFDLDLEPDSEVSLTAGRLLDNHGRPQFALDLALSHSPLFVEEFLDRPMSFFWQPLARQFSIDV